MMALFYEIMSVVNFVLAIVYRYVTHDDNNALFCLLVAILMAIMSIKYDRGNND